MDYATFASNYPALARAAWEMFCDAGGSEMLRERYEADTAGYLVGISPGDLGRAEMEMTQLELNREAWITALCGEYEEAKALVSENLHGVLNALFGEG